MLFVVPAVAKFHPSAKLPERAQAGDAGFDLSFFEMREEKNGIPVEHESNAVFQIPAGGQRLCGTGIMLQMPNDVYAQILPRSGLAVKNSIIVMAGVIDSGYRGEVCVVLRNAGTVPLYISVGERIAQLVFHERLFPTIKTLPEIDIHTATTTDRGASGFGSTGAK